ncbi:hypothetical protein BJF93_04605 [Xaviernesmea oryzae]|uniref:Methyl-accepting chemotaxis protein n=1 Tax=Xaviernesmea oryzae TaxID=464029 RepID=A0A1Q9AUX4_9HYPH|nr:methyl-accepting chemotaxis protein [Xaviernesmea oryzae]OLP59188.1 hypothetical protein BJF93_04605 [Xaviernesmea oryzae]SEK82543.1 methyl-accepting chemotaxis protein [Xaviernesmea oryzae]
MAFFPVKPRRPSIRTALVAVFSVLALIVCGFAGATLDSLVRIQAAADGLSRDSMPSIAAARDVKEELMAMRTGYLQHISATSPDETKEAEDAIRSAQVNVRAAIERYQAIVVEPKEKLLLKTVSDRVAAYIKTGEGMLILSRMGQYKEANRVAAAMRGYVLPALKAIDNLIALNNGTAAQAVAASEKAGSTAATIIYAIAGLVALILILSTLYVLRGVARPIGAITRTMTRLASGDTAQPVPYVGRGDEIGLMANALEIFRASAIEKMRLESEAEAARAKAETDRLRLAAEAEAQAGERLRQATSGLAAGLKRLAAGDLTVSLDQAMAPEFEALRHDLNAAVAQLRETLAAVAEVADGIGMGAQEVSQSADDLSRRTEHQAASLEQTAAALDEITANVAASTKRTDEAREMAQSANSSAHHSESVVRDAIEAMGRIEQSSSQISSIIGVIDEIAFQTNLLALNAGVEAARAGEAGRGFAVVAQEVRELAQRSAKAAKEIKDLIRHSTNEVESGVRLVSATGESLGLIGSQIGVINQHVEAIALPAREQATGLSEVNSAVNQMDQVTQQNAAMVEEANAAGATLASESERLRSLISHFRLSGAVQPAERFAA